METIEIVMDNGLPLPSKLQKLFHDWTVVRSNMYAIYTIKGLHYIGDEHLDALDEAFKARQIMHWASGHNKMDMDASTFNV